MIPSTHAVLVYHQGSDKPDSLPWGNIYEEFKDDPEWLQAVEATLARGDTWEGPPKGASGIVRISESRIWQE